MANLVESYRPLSYKKSVYFKNVRIYFRYSICYDVTLPQFDLHARGQCLTINIMTTVCVRWVTFLRITCLGVCTSTYHLSLFLCVGFLWVFVSFFLWEMRIRDTEYRVFSKKCTNFGSSPFLPIWIFFKTVWRRLKIDH